MTITVATATARAIAAAGIDSVFGLPGGEVLVLIDELRKAGVDFVLMRHEANAGLAAAVYGKLRGTTGVVLATLGPGAANLLLPVSNAYLDQEPLLAITAQIPAEFPAAHTHQLLAAPRDLPAGLPLRRDRDGDQRGGGRAACAGGLPTASVRGVVPHLVRARGAEDRGAVRRVGRGDGAAQPDNGRCPGRPHSCCAGGSRRPSGRWS